MVDEEIWQKHRRELEEEYDAQQELDEMIYIYGRSDLDD